MCCRSQAVCVSGMINYLVNRRSGPGLDCVIVAFELASQSFHLVSLPECSNNYKAVHLALLGGCLCVVGNIGMYSVDVWVMGEYGVKESWNKLVAWTLAGSARHYNAYVEPIIYLKNGREVLFKVNQQHFVIYDVEDKEAKETWLCNPCCLCTFVYSESLV
ncbi:F-box protein CPR1-like [Bidens hawaiensis]|uniref:F-box protein CPR1-like n=1 Tax=Bidens hawaiensis TaxID=980011 RepID=UPI00404AC6FC